MPRVVGIDPGTLSIDLCGLDDGRVFMDESHPTADALSDPRRFVARLEAAGPLDLVAGPSGYGLPLVAARDLSDADLKLAFLAAEGEAGGIGGLRALARAFGASAVPMVFTPGVIHLASVPPHRKVNRVDMGTADKLCATVLALHSEARRRGCSPAEVSFVLLELGGAFSAAVAVADGRIVDGAGGTSGPLGVRAAGALDGEVAYLAGGVGKALLFSGGAAAIAGRTDAEPDWLLSAEDDRSRLARDAYIESALKWVAALATSLPGVPTVVVSGRLAHVAALRERLQTGLARLFGDVPVHVVTGFARVAKHAAQGAALLADGLSGGASAPLVERLDIRDAAGTALDHLYLISPAAARARLGLS